MLLTCLGGYLSAGGASARQPLLGPRHRRADEAHRDAPRGGRADRPAGGAVVRDRARRALDRRPLGWASTPSPAALSFAGFLCYVFVYTIWLKRTTPQNIVIGGAAGAVPPLVGWAAATGGLSLDRGLPLRDRLLLDPAALLGAQPAHEGRVRQGRRPDDAGGPRRARDAQQIVLYSLLLYAVTQLPFCAGGIGGIYLVASLVLGRRSSAARSLLYRRADRRSALRLYLFSLAYLALLFGAMVLDARL